MELVIIGSGHVATVLGRAVRQAGHEVVQVLSRNPDHARRLAAQLEATRYGTPDTLVRGKSLYLLAVADTAIPELAASLKLKDEILVHTAGSVSMDALAGASTRYGVLYPLQSLRSEAPEIPQIPVLVDGNTEACRGALSDFAHTFSRQVIIANDQQRLHLHVGAVLSSNFINHLLALTRDYCDDAGVDFTLLLPLLRETINRSETTHPASRQTGPAIRGDESTIDKHRSVLKDNQRLALIYEVFTRSIRDYHNEGQRDI